MFSLTFELGFCGVGATANPFELRLVFLRVFGGRESLMSRLRRYAEANVAARAEIERLTALVKRLQDALAVARRMFDR